MRRTKWRIKIVVIVVVLSRTKSRRIEGNIARNHALSIKVFSNIPYQYGRIVMGMGMSPESTRRVMWPVSNGCLILVVEVNGVFSLSSNKK